MILLASCVLLPSDARERWDLTTDLDGDGQTEQQGDCAPWHADTFAGAAFEEEPEACMTDADGDGWGAGVPRGKAVPGTDCRDLDSRVNPGQIETCSTDIDDNCDGVVNESDAAGCELYWEDPDKDEYAADDAEQVCACGVTVGLAEVRGDCAPDESDRNPGAEESCSTDYDDDCDGRVNEEGAAECQEYFEDGDGDGYGFAGGDCLCSAEGALTTTRDGDCDDADATIHPGADEDCEGVDMDCDGVVDSSSECGCTSLETAAGDYLFCGKAKTWSDAKDWCQVQGMHLATINSSTENAAIFAAWPSTCTEATHTAWLSFNDQAVEGTWNWAYGSSTYTNWNSGEPNGGASDDCARMTQTGGTWSDAGCTAALHWICE